MSNNFLALFFCFLTVLVQGQDENKVFQTFKDTRVINSHSTEILKQGRMDFRIGHRFGDFLGSGGGWETFFGLENATDIMIGFDLGIAKNLMIGVNRTKGSGILKQNINALVKARIAEQDIEGRLPFSLAVLGEASVSTMPRSSNINTITYFAKFAHRMAYHAEVLLARKFSDYFSLQATAAWTYRNIVASLDKNDLVSVSLSSRIQLNKSIGIILDGRYVVSDIRNSENGYFPPLGIGLEWETGGGHVFQLNFTNATGISQTDYIPYTRSNWGDGQFRLGFTIGRQFKI